MQKQRILQFIHRNYFIRMAYFPIYYVYRTILHIWYRLGEDSQYLRSLKNRYKGKRCFIIGNGPSLLPRDLDKIKNEVSFASNRIFQIYGKTNWRPTYYVSIDIPILSVEIDNIKRSGDYPKFLHFKAAKYGRKKEDKIHYILCDGKFRLNFDDPAVDSLSADVSHHASKVHTVTVTAIELAIYMGFKKIYLLGVDNNYKYKVDQKGKVYIDPTVKASYFEGMQDNQGKALDKQGLQNVEAVNYSYKIAQKFADLHGVKIYNATRGGKLEIFERVDFDDLIK